ncbi:hypothetical protein CL629_03350 [bacterium]|nr:hypothetical protein [bacterium]|tara:strand:- start:466 stop:894 length:429 start_codon:yes stop_codon:yes gene_type:complete
MSNNENDILEELRREKKEEEYQETKAAMEEQPSEYPIERIMNNIKGYIWDAAAYSGSPGTSPEKRKEEARLLINQIAAYYQIDRKREDIPEPTPEPAAPKTHEENSDELRRTKDIEQYTKNEINRILEETNRELQTRFNIKL